MKFEYSNHAEENIAERKLTKKAIEETVANPDTILVGRFGRMIAQKLFEKKMLRVVYEQRNMIRFIVTAYITKPERYIEK